MSKGQQHETRSEEKTMSNKINSDATISYQSTDFDATLTGGVARDIDGKPVVEFDVITHDGRRVLPCLRTDTRADLAALVVQAAERQAVLDWRPEGLAEYTYAVAAVRNVERANERSRRDGTCCYHLDTDEVAAVKALAAKYPAAALWEDAERQRDIGSWSDPTGQIAAAEKCLEILRTGGSVEAAEIALAERAELDMYR